MGAPPRPRPPAPPFPQYDPTSNLCIPFQAQYYPDAYGTACANPLPGGQYGLPDLDALDAGPGRCQPGLDYVVGGGRVGLGGGWAWVVCLSATPRTPPIAFQPRCRRSPHLPSPAPSSFTPPSPLHTICFLRPTTPPGPGPLPSTLRLTPPALPRPWTALWRCATPRPSVSTRPHQKPCSSTNTGATRGNEGGIGFNSRMLLMGTLRATPLRDALAHYFPPQILSQTLKGVRAAQRPGARDAGWQGRCGLAPARPRL